VDSLAAALVRARDARAAHEQFTSMGMEAFAQRARSELVATGEKMRNRTVATRDDLTAPQRQIAQLARDGLSNAAIAARLFLSRAPWSGHMRHVFTKLGSGPAGSWRAPFQPPTPKSSSIDPRETRRSRAGSRVRHPPFFVRFVRLLRWCCSGTYCASRPDPGSKRRPAGRCASGRPRVALRAYTTRDRARESPGAAWRDSADACCCVVSVTHDVAIGAGGSRGAGREIARTLASRGYAVVMVYLPDQGAADSAVEEILGAERHGARRSRRRDRRTRRRALAR
jgi:DNA-binding CsgD family transcriptional regulator